MLSTQEQEQELELKQAHAPSRVCPPQHTHLQLHLLQLQLPPKSTSVAAVKSARDIVWHHWAGRWRAKAPKTRRERRRLSLYAEDKGRTPPAARSNWLLLNPNSAAASVSSGCQAGIFGSCCCRCWCCCWGCSKCSLETRRRLAQVTKPPSPEPCWKLHSARNA